MSDALSVLSSRRRQQWRIIKIVCVAYLLSALLVERRVMKLAATRIGSHLLNLNEVESANGHSPSDKGVPYSPVGENASSSVQRIVPVFYNLFVRNESDTERVSSLVQEQLSFAQPEHRVFVNSIGYRMPVPITRLGHYESGSEMLTLHTLWEYCTHNSDDTVVYLHSKGSFHPSSLNDALRKFLTASALSRECLAHRPQECNVCSARFSPLPHPHTPGNMWLAECSYVRRLMDPLGFEKAMSTAIPRELQKKHYPGCLGLSRYAAEHWVHSHPTVAPCDLYDNPEYVWAYQKVPPLDKFVPNLAAAPRFSLDTYEIPGMCRNAGISGNDRIEEYRKLYNETPSKDWWGWSLYNDTVLGTNVSMA